MQQKVKWIKSNLLVYIILVFLNILHFEIQLLKLLEVTGIVWNKRLGK